MDRRSPDRRLQKRSRKIPVGFEFRPRDWELVLYLRRRVHGVYVEEGLFHDVNLYNHHPSKLIELFALRSENKAYLFSPRSRKYPNGSRPCRSADGGFWKASGKDVDVENEAGEPVGKKRSLSFYEGHQATKGRKTNWLMHEYKIDESHRPPDPTGNDSSTLDDWVLCVVYLHQKTQNTVDGDLYGEQEDRKFQTGSSQDQGAASGLTVAAASSHANTEMMLYMDAAATTLGNAPGHHVDDNIVTAILGDPSTSTAPWPSMMVIPDQVHTIDAAAAAAAAEINQVLRRGKDTHVVDESGTFCCGGGYETDTLYASFMGTMDPLGAASALDLSVTTTMEAVPPLPSFWYPAGLPAELLQYDHGQQDYMYSNIGILPFDQLDTYKDNVYGYDPEVITPLSIIHPQVLDTKENVFASCNPSSSAPSMEQYCINDQPAAAQVMEPPTSSTTAGAAAPKCGGTDSGMPTTSCLNHGDHVMPPFSGSDDDEFWNNVLNESDSWIEELSVDDFNF